MRVWIFDNLAGSWVEPIQSVLLVRRVPDHPVAIDADGVGARLGSWQRKFLERFRFRVEAADLVALALREPDDSVIIHFEALGLTLRRRGKFGQHPVLR